MHHQVVLLERLLAVVDTEPFSSPLISLRTIPKTVEGSFVACRLRGLSDRRLFVAIRITATSHTRKVEETELGKSFKLLCS